MKREKVACPVCRKVVALSRLIFTKKSGIKETAKEKKNPFYLYAMHPPKKGCETMSVRSQQTGKILETHCAGSMRPRNWSPQKAVR